jgi:hypothetical protein
MFFCYFPTPLQDAESAGLQGKTALNFRIRVDAKGHNNIKHQSRVPRDGSSPQCGADF